MRRICRSLTRRTSPFTVRLTSSRFPVRRSSGCGGFKPAHVGQSRLGKGLTVLHPAILTIRHDQGDVLPSDPLGNPFVMSPTGIQELAAFFLTGSERPLWLLATKWPAVHTVHVICTEEPLEAVNFPAGAAATLRCPFQVHAFTCPGLLDWTRA